MFEKRKYQKQFSTNDPLKHHHCNQPEINININNNGDDDNDLSPAIIDLINRINKVENTLDDLDLSGGSSGSNINLGENEGQAYPGEKGAKNAYDIRRLTEDVDNLSNELSSKVDINNFAELSGKLSDKVNTSELIELSGKLSDELSDQLSYKADKSEIPDAEIYYVNEFEQTPAISGLYIKGNESKFWDGIQWHDLSIKTSSNLSDQSSEFEVPTAKAVFQALNEKLGKNELDIEMNKYATDEEVQQFVEAEVNNKINNEYISSIVSGMVSGGITGNEDSYNDLINSISDFQNSIK
jgi:hypothetical protein